MGEWRTMESAPRDEAIDVWNGHGRIVDAYWGRPDDEPKDTRAWVHDMYERDWGLVSYRIKPEPTHWMPVPPPPASPTLRETVDAIRAELTPEQTQAIADMAEDSRPAVRGVE